MTTGEKFLVGTASALIAGIIIYLIGISAGWWKNPFAPKTEPAPGKSDYDKCVEANKSKTDGEACGNCVSEGSGQPNFNGVIKDGVCVPKQESINIATIKYVVTNTNGAVIYNLSGSNFSASVPVKKVPVNTQVEVISVSPDAKYVNTSLGWLDINDIGVIQ